MQRFLESCRIMIEVQEFFSNILLMIQENFVELLKMIGKGIFSDILLSHPEETSKNSDICDFSKVSDIGKVLYSMEN